MTRPLSFWGWGYEDRFPDAEARKNIGSLVAALLAVEPPEPRPPPTLESVSLPPSRLEPPPDKESLASVTPADRASHTYGKSFRDLVRGFAGDFSVAPDLVLRPQNDADVPELLDWCSSRGAVVVPFGGGTSVVGGVEAPRGDRPVVSLDLRALDRVLEVDAVSRAARIQAGATGPGLEAQLAPSGLTLRHFPQSFEFSTLGGWIATRAGGHFATLHTHIEDRVESVRMHTPRGLWESRRLPASGAGPRIDGLVAGSEGILGVITEAWVRLVPRPKWRSKATAYFGRLDNAVSAARALAQSELHPANCRLLDGGESRLHQVDSEGRSVLLIGFESADHPVDGSLRRTAELVRDYGGIMPEDETRHSEGGERADGGAASSWRDAFIEMPYLFNSLVSLGFVVDTFETACTWDKFRALYDRVTAAVRDVTARECGGGLVTMRFTHVYPDGPAPYFTFIAPGREGGALEQWSAVKAVASDAVLASGGTITHHHAVGRVHRPWYDRERPDGFAEALRAAKRALDPDGMLNPGVLVDP